MYDQLQNTEQQRKLSFAVIVILKEAGGIPQHYTCTGLLRLPTSHCIFLSICQSPALGGVGCLRQRLGSPCPCLCIGPAT